MEENLDGLQYYANLSPAQKIQAIRNETKPILVTITGMANMLETAIEEQADSEILMEYVTKIINAGIYLEKVIEIMTGE
jgi:hypothetical protein